MNPECRTARGQAMVEFALVFPLFIVTLLGILEFGFIVYTQNTVNHAAQEGARRGEVLGRITPKASPNAFTQDGNRDGTYNGLRPCDRATIVGSVACAIAPLDRARATATINTPAGNDPVPAGFQVEVIVDYAHQPLVAIALLPQTAGISLRGTAETLTQ